MDASIQVFYTVLKFDKEGRRNVRYIREHQTIIVVSRGAQGVSRDWSWAVTACLKQSTVARLEVTLIHTQALSQFLSVAHYTSFLCGRNWDTLGTRLRRSIVQSWSGTCGCFVHLWASQVSHTIPRSSWRYLLTIPIGLHSDHMKKKVLVLHDTFTTNMLLL